jgi:hypothetical protein
VPTRGNVGTISLGRTLPAETTLPGWACRTRTCKCHSEKCPLKRRPNSPSFRDIWGPETFRVRAAETLTCTVQLNWQRGGRIRTGLCLEFRICPNTLRQVPATGVRGTVRERPASETFTTPEIQPILTRFWFGSGPPGNCASLPPIASDPRSMPTKPILSMSAATSVTCVIVSQSETQVAKLRFNARPKGVET